MTTKCCRRIWADTAKVLVPLLLVACGSPLVGREEAADPTPTRTVDSVICPACQLLAGGESGDFGGGAISDCESFARRRPINIAEAEALGFDITKAISRIEREIDAPLYLRPGSSSSSLAENNTGMVSGYAPETRIKASVKADQWLVVELDPDRCRDSLCTFASGETREVTDCIPRLEVNLSSIVSFADGSLRGSGTGSGIYQPSDDSWDYLIGSTRIDLSTATGTLYLGESAVIESHNSEGNGPNDSEQSTAALWIQFEFYSEQTLGALEIQFVQQATGGLPMPLSPLLVGTWASPFGTGRDMAMLEAD